MNKIMITANLTREPELKFVPSTGMAICKFSVANNEGWGDKKTVSFLNCTAFNKTAEAIASYTNKGSKVLIDGRLQTGSYEKQDGTKAYTTDIIVNQIEFLDKKSDGVKTLGSEAESEDLFKPATDDEDNPFS